MTAAGRAMALTSAANVPTLVVNLLTGVLAARLLAPSGRGEVAAVVAWLVVLDLVVSLGVREAATFLVARGNQPPAAVTGTALAMAAVLGLAAVVVGHLVLPLALAAQREHLVDLARLAALMLVPMTLAATGYALLNGHQRFAGAAAYRLLQPVLLLAGLLGLWATGAVSVGAVLGVHAASWVAMVAVVAWLLRGVVEIGRPSRAVARASLRYGVHLHGQQLGSLASARLDLMVMPMLLAPDRIGLYAVAVSAASLVMPLFSQVRTVVFAAGARSDAARSVGITTGALRFTLFGSALTALALGLVAPLALSVVYGQAFVDAAHPLRILLPGIVAWAGAAILTSGLNALGRPGVASVAQLVGAGLTVIGLLVTLPTLGIEGAALTSSISYTGVFVFLAVAMRGAPGWSLWAALSPRRMLDDLRGLRHRRASDAVPADALSDG